MLHFSEQMETIKYFAKALKFVWDSGWKWTVAKLILLVLQALLPLLTLYLMKLVVDEVTANITTPTEDAWWDVFWLVLYWGGLNLMSVTVQTIAGFVSENQSQYLQNYMAKMIQEKSVQLDLAYYEMPKYLNTLHRAQQESNYRPLQLLNSITQLLQNSLTLIGVIGLLFYLHWTIPVILFVAGLPSLFVKIFYSEKQYTWQRQRTQFRRESHYLGSLMTQPQYAMEVRLFRLGRFLSQQFDIIQQKLIKERIRLAFHEAWSSLAAKSVEILALVGAYGFIVFRTLKGLISVGDLVMFFGVFQRGQTALVTLLTSIANLYEHKLFLHNLFEFLELKPIALKGDIPMPDLATSPIRFENVSFSYPLKEKKSLTDVSLEARMGEVISLVGHNGAGKTTLVKLLSRLYEPSEGRIMIGETPIDQIEVDSLRKQLSVIFQDFTKYRRSAKENIAMGDIEQDISLDKVQEAAQLTGADEVIKSLPSEYDSMLGRLFEKGQELSMGQWQKVALARAFYSDAKIIILDEPTSSMDALAEHLFFERLKEVAKDKIIFLITHRLSSATLSDRIYYLEEGRILESGTHQELVSKEGEYAALFNKQAQLYRA